MNNPNFSKGAHINLQRKIVADLRVKKVNAFMINLDTDTLQLTICPEWRFMPYTGPAQLLKDLTNYGSV